MVRARVAVNHRRESTPSRSVDGLEQCARGVGGAAAIPPIVSV